MALPLCLLLSMGGMRSNAQGPHQRRNKSLMILRGPPCAHGVLSTPHEEVRDTYPHQTEVYALIDYTRSRDTNFQFAILYGATLCLP